MLFWSVQVFITLQLLTAIGVGQPFYQNTMRVLDGRREKAQRLSNLAGSVLPAQSGKAITSSQAYSKKLRDIADRAVAMDTEVRDLGRRVAEEHKSNVEGVTRRLHDALVKSAEPSQG